MRPTRSERIMGAATGPGGRRAAISRLAQLLGAGLMMALVSSCSSSEPPSAPSDPANSSQETQAAYYGVPNYANSPIIQKFMDSLPGLNTPNNLGQMLPVATPDTVTYPGSDYYEIALQQYTLKMHSQLPPTTVRGYVQLNNGTDANGQNTVPPAPVNYLGPVIVAQKDRPVRVKFTNMLPTGAGGDLFLPVDTTVMGAGTGPLGGTENYTQNRATLHLHGGATPWISDGTPHQWTTPAGEVTSYPQGVSVSNVPDMPDPGPGSLTFFYTNQQSARFMFYHDHSYGMTRLNVYAGEAAGYVLQDPVEQQLVSSGVVPADQIPLVIQDKTFVPDPATLALQDPTWDSAHWGGTGSLWLPHVYMPNQDPTDPSGANPMGRWDYGPWFWPPMNAMSTSPYQCDANGTPNPLGAKLCPGTPSPSIVPEAFMDTPVVNGTAYPYLVVQPKAYRFRILNAANDRTLNLQLYFADPTIPAGAPGDGTEVKMVAAVPHPVTPVVDGDPDDLIPQCTPTVTTNCWPVTWPTDGRDGGVPDPLTVGPSMIQIGTEGGLLPAPVVLPNTPIGYEYNRRNIVVLNVNKHTLLLGPAERADVIVDFSAAPPGSKLILYNDAPAPVPGFDPRYDYYTGDPDLTPYGGAPTTQPGFGPNTRTIMQIIVDPAGVPAPNPSLLTNLQAALPAAYAASQPPPIVPQAAYGPAFGTTFTDTFSAIQDTQLTFTPVGGSAPITVPLQPKAIQELFDQYGRMNATLGVELPFTNIMTQTTIPYGYIDPPTETVVDSVTQGSVVASDGTQIWKITHNGVDTHAIHFHLFNVQLINRVGWDGAISPPEPNELGWKETVRMNPLEDAIVALRPIAPTLPWKLGESVRPLDVTAPIGSTMGFANIDPQTGNPVTVTNELTNFGWEYVWHCHILGHEENDMMRPLVFQVAPAAPANLAATASALSTSAPTVTLSWTDSSTVPAATTFTLQRATAPDFSGTVVSTSVTAPATSFVDSTVAQHTTYYYRVRAEDAAAYSTWSDSATVTTPGQLPAAPTALALVAATRTTIATSWTDNASNEQGFYLQRRRQAQAWAAAATLTANATAYTDTGLTRNQNYSYRIQAYNKDGVSAWSNVLVTKTLP